MMNPTMDWIDHEGNFNIHNALVGTWKNIPLILWQECPFIPRKVGDQISEEFSVQAWEKEYLAEEDFWDKLKNWNIDKNTFKVEL